MKQEQFVIPLAGLKEKVYYFEYELEESFFDAEEPQVLKPEIRVDLKFDKTNDPYVLDFSIYGKFKGTCDKCAATIDIPIDGEYRLFVEIGDTENDDDTEVVFIPQDAFELRLYDHVHDFVYLSLPVIKSCDEPFNTPFCDKEVGEILEKSNPDKDSDPRWEILKNLKK